GRHLRGFFGGVVLRGEGHTLPHTGRLSLLKSANPIESLLRGGLTPLLEMGMSKSIMLAENNHIAAMLEWSESAFAEFAFDLVAMFQGVYEVGARSSFYGLGSTWHELIRDLGRSASREEGIDT